MGQHLWRGRTQLDRFNGSVVANGNTPCLLFIGSGGRYGELYWDGCPQRAHRVAWQIANGRIPNGLHVLHSCDTPRCVNPEHLYLGTYSDNMDDKRKRGRGLLRLTMGQVKQIVSLYSTGKYSFRALAVMFGVSYNTVRFHVKREAGTPMKKKGTNGKRLS